MKRSHIEERLVSPLPIKPQDRRQNHEPRRGTKSTKAEFLGDGHRLVAHRLAGIRPPQHCGGRTFASPKMQKSTTAFLFVPLAPFCGHSSRQIVARAAAFREDKIMSREEAQKSQKLNSPGPFLCASCAFLRPSPFRQSA